MSKRSSSIPIGVACVCVVACAGVAFGTPSTPVRVLIEDPERGEPVRNDVHQAPIRGMAIAEGERPLEIDVMIVIDVSGSTAQASGVDVDEDGELGFDPRQELVAPGTYPPDTICTDPDDTILAAEIKAADALIQNLDASRLRVGVVTFSGEVHPTTFKQAAYGQQDAWVEIPLTNDFVRARRSLGKILARGPHGGTDFAAGIRVAVTELAGLMDAKSTSRPGSKKIVMFLTDGVPSFPFGRSNVQDPGDVEAALNAARVAHKAGVTINAYALGPTALTNPMAATELSRITLGTFTPVRNPGDVITYLQGASFANVDDVIFTNLTTSEISEDVQLSPDGSFSGYVPVREGTNRVRVTALATDGSEGSVEFDLEFEVSGLSDRELALELERIRKRNKELQLLIESERIQRFRAKQRKDLKLEAEDREEGE